jgi:hypothetical protein
MGTWTPYSFFSRVTDGCFCDLQSGSNGTARAAKSAGKWMQKDSGKVLFGKQFTRFFCTPRKHLEWRL